MTPRRSGRGAERRRTTRADARLSMRVEGAAQESDDGQIVTESQNISASGVYCNSSHYMAPLSKVALTIVLPRVPGGRSTKELIKCEGIVVRCEQSAKRRERPFELACMFSGLEADVKQRIDAFVTWRNLQALRAAARATPRKTAVKKSRTAAARAATRAGAARAASSTRTAAARRKTVH